MISARDGARNVDRSVDERDVLHFQVVLPAATVAAFLILEGPCGSHPARIGSITDAMSSSPNPCATTASKRLRMLVIDRSERAR